MCSWVSTHQPFPTGFRIRACPCECASGQPPNPTTSSHRWGNRAWRILSDFPKVTQLGKSWAATRIWVLFQDTPISWSSGSEINWATFEACMISGLRWYQLWSSFNYKSSLETNEGIKAVILVIRPGGWGKYNKDIQHFLRVFKYK